MGIGKFQPHTKSIPLNWSTKNRHSWLRRRGEPLYQIWYKSIRWGLLGKRVKCNKKYVLLIYLFIPFSQTQTRLQVRPDDGFLHASDAIAQKTWNHARMCIFGAIKLKFNFKSLFIPKPSNCGQKRDLFFFDRKRLTVGMLNSKLPLIIIVAP